MSVIDRATDIAQIVDSSLFSIGYHRRIKDEDVRVKIQSVICVPDKFVVIAIDPKLPPMVSLDRLMSDTTIQTLSTNLSGLKIIPVKHEGLLYIVCLDSIEKIELSSTQLEMIKYAIENLGGRFVVSKLKDKFGVSVFELQAMCAKWETQGWLKREGTAKNSSRVITDALKSML